MKRLVNILPKCLKRKPIYLSKQPVIVLEGTPMFQDGGIGYIVDRDFVSGDRAYLVCPLHFYYKHEANIGKLLDHAFWVKESDLREVNFKRETDENLFERISKMVNSSTKKD